MTRTFTAAEQRARDALEAQGFSPGEWKALEWYAHQEGWEQTAQRPHLILDQIRQIDGPTAFDE